jgi:uncharacterized protein (TIGR03067 family)
MAAQSGFRQKCPSCTAPVLISNPGVVGRKIDCPNCRHRFIVRGPDGKIPDAGSGAKSNPAPSSGIRKPPGVAAKPAPGVDDEEEQDVEWEDEDEEDEDEDEEEDEEDEDDEESAEDEDDDEDDEDEDDEEDEDEDDEDDEDDEEGEEEDDEDEEDDEEEEEEEDADEAAPAAASALKPLPPEPPKKSSSKVLKIGVALAAVALVALGVGGYVLFYGPGKSTNPRRVENGGDRPSIKEVNGGDKRQEPPAREVKAAVPNAGPDVLEADVSNLLPNDTEAVLDIPIQRLLGTAFKQSAFTTPYAFSADAFRKTFGFPIENVDRIVTAANPAGDWIFSVVRTVQPVQKETLVDRLRLVPGGKVSDFDYYLIRRPLDNLSNLLLKVVSPRGQLALHVMDSRTFLVANVAPLKKFLEDKRHPAELKDPPAPAPAPPPPGRPAPAPAARAARPAGFRTIAPALRAVLYEMEAAAKEPEAVLLREAVAGSTAFALLKMLAEQYDQQWKTTGELARLVRKQVGATPKAGGFCLLALTETNLSVELAAHLASPDAAEEAAKQIASILPLTMKGANLDLSRDGGGNKPGPVAAPPAAAADNKGKDGTWSAWSSGPVAAFNVRLFLSDAQYQTVLGFLRGFLVNLRLHAEMAETRPRIRELAEAIQAYVKDRRVFPPAALDRPTTPEHPIPWRPDQRLSWLVGLLPYLPSGDYDTLVVDRDLGWNEGMNLVTGLMPVPYFLAPVHSPNPDWRWVMYWGQYWPLAASHYVGIAGVGMDAADYRADDPQTAAKLGIFGYDRVTHPSEIKDGLANTIVAVQVAADKARPWMAGGGSTVRAVSEEDTCVQPFVCLDYRGRRGTFAIMADGKVRFIPATIPPATFRALCTIAGGEVVKDLDEVAPVVEPEDGGEWKPDAPPLPVAASGTPRPAPTADGRLIQGTWNLVRRESNGKAFPPEETNKVVLNVVGDRYLLRVPKSPAQARTFKLDPEKKPKWIDLTDAETKAVTPGIYEVSAEELKVCLAQPEAPTGSPGKRPGGFDSTAAELLVFKRAEDPALLLEMERLRSSWALVNGEIGGIKIPPAVAENTRLVIDGYQYSFTLNGRTDEGTLVLESKTSDGGSADVITADGKVLHALYFLPVNAKQLIFCIAAPGADRPKEMKGGPGIQYLNFKRVHNP